MVCAESRNMLAWKDLGQKLTSSIFLPETKNPSPEGSGEGFEQQVAFKAPADQ